MRIFTNLCLVLAVATLPGPVSSAVQAVEPGWTPRIIKRGQDRVQSDSTDILLRPYRPLHFYGNTVRRVYYRGVARPTMNDIRTTVYYVVRGG